MAAPTLLALGPGAVDETQTLTWINLIPGIRDNIFRENTLLGWLFGNSKKTVKGGSSLSHGIRYAKSTAGGSYSRYGLLDTTPQDNLTRDQWPWKQYYHTVAIDGFTKRVNQGQYAIDDANEEKKEQAEMSLKDDLEIDLFQASPATDDIRSLPVLVLDSGTEGQINGGTSTWWQSVLTTAGSWAAGVGRSALVTLCNTLAKRNPTGMPDILVSDQDDVERYESSLVSQYRYTNNKPDIGAAPKLLFKEIPWIWSVQATANIIYALHSKSIDLTVHKDADFEMTQMVKPANQDALIGQILFMAAVTTGNRRKLGKTTGNAA